MVAIEKKKKVSYNQANAPSTRALKQKNSTIKTSTGLKSHRKEQEVTGVSDHRSPVPAMKASNIQSISAHSPSANVSHSRPAASTDAGSSDRAYEGLVFHHLVALMQLLLRSRAQETLHDANLINGHAPDRAVAAVNERLKVLESNLTYLQGPALHHRVTAVTQLLNELTNELESAVFSYNRQLVLSMKEDQSALYRSTAKIQRERDEALAVKDQKILALQAEKSDLGKKNESLVRTVELLSNELGTLTHQLNEANQNSVTTGLQCIDYKSQVDGRASSILSSVQSRLGFVPSSVRKELHMLTLLEPPGNINYEAMRQHQKVLTERTSSNSNNNSMVLTPQRHKAINRLSRSTSRSSSPMEKNSTELHLRNFNEVVNSGCDPFQCKPNATPGNDEVSKVDSFQIPDKDTKKNIFDSNGDLVSTAHTEQQPVGIADLLSFSAPHSSGDAQRTEQPKLQKDDLEGSAEGSSGVSSLHGGVSSIDGSSRASGVTSTYSERLHHIIDNLPKMNEKNDKEPEGADVYDLSPPHANIHLKHSVNQPSSNEKNNTKILPSVSQTKAVSVAEEKRNVTPKKTGVNSAQKKTSATGGEGRRDVRKPKNISLQMKKPTSRPSLKKVEPKPPKFIQSGVSSKEKVARMDQKPGQYPITESILSNAERFGAANVTAGHTSQLTSASPVTEGPAINTNILEEPEQDPLMWNDSISTTDAEPSRGAASSAVTVTTTASTLGTTTIATNAAVAGPIPRMYISGIGGCLSGSSRDERTYNDSMMDESLVRSLDSASQNNAAQEAMIEEERKRLSKRYSAVDENNNKSVLNASSNEKNRVSFCEANAQPELSIEEMKVDDNQERERAKSEDSWVDVLERSGLSGGDEIYDFTKGLDDDNDDVLIGTTTAPVDYSSSGSDDDIEELPPLEVLDDGEAAAVIDDQEAVTEEDMDEERKLLEEQNRFYEAMNNHINKYYDDEETVTSDDDEEVDTYKEQYENDTHEGGVAINAPSTIDHSSAPMVNDGDDDSSEFSYRNINDEDIDGEDSNLGSITEHCLISRVSSLAVDEDEDYYDAYKEYMKNLMTVSHDTLPSEMINDIASAQLKLSQKTEDSRLLSHLSDPPSDDDNNQLYRPAPPLVSVSNATGGVVKSSKVAESQGLTLKARGATSTKQKQKQNDMRSKIKGNGKIMRNSSSAGASKSVKPSTAKGKELTAKASNHLSKLSRTGKSEKEKPIAQMKKQSSSKHSSAENVGHAHVNSFKRTNLL